MPRCSLCKQEAPRSAFASSQLSKKSRMRCKACASLPVTAPPVAARSNPRPHSAAAGTARGPRPHGAEACTVAGRPQVDTLLVLDFEGTCDGESDRPLTRLEQCSRHEIIEWPCVRVCVASGEQTEIFHSFVRPVEGAAEGHTRRLTEYCTELTGIEQSQVEDAPLLGVVVERFVAWLEARGLIEALRTGSTVLVAHGEWDLSDQLPAECGRKGIVLPPCLRESTDLKIPFADTMPLEWHGGVGTGLGMLAMLERLQMSLEGRHHCGLDDARNLARVAARLASMGADMSHTHRCCDDEGGAGGARAAAAPALANGFGALALDEPEPTAGEASLPLLPARAPLPPPREPPRLHLLRGRGASVRETDWACACGGSTFGRRLHCFRCGALKPGATAQDVAAAAARAAPRPGDWRCPSPSCAAVVFASRRVCFKCGAAKG